MRSIIFLRYVYLGKYVLNSIVLVSIIILLQEGHVSMRSQTSKHHTWRIKSLKTFWRVKFSGY